MVLATACGWLRKVVGAGPDTVFGLLFAWRCLGVFWQVLLDTESRMRIVEAERRRVEEFDGEGCLCSRRVRV